MKKIIALFCLLATSAFAAPTIEVTSDGTVIIDGLGRGSIQDVVKNSPDLASAIRSVAKTTTEALIDAAALKANPDPYRADLKPLVDLVKSAGVTLDATKEASVTASKTAVDGKRAEQDSKINK